MITHLYSHFLTSPQEYVEVEEYWISLWEQVDPDTRLGWKQPWFEPLPPSISEGNPIFTAVSQSTRRAIRVIQFEPTEPTLELVAYLDTFGGTFTDPKAIHELVISCALSDIAALQALSLMQSWVGGRGLSAEFSVAGLILSRSFMAEKLYDVPFFGVGSLCESTQRITDEPYGNRIYEPAA
jgi:hypothetical protein